jgi:hypothetical protein
LILALATGNVALAIALYYVGLGFAVIGLGLSIAGTILGFNRPEKFSLRGLALAGAIVSFLVLLIILLAILA